jgi:Holliday junction resolvase RusA-like endonuclease
MGITLKELKAQCSTDTAALNADVFGATALRNAGDLGAGVEQALSRQGRAAQSIVLPLPPSTNANWHNYNGRTVLSDETCNYRAAVKLLANAAGVYPFDGDVAVYVSVYRSRADQDLDNYSGKTLLDALNGVMFHDDIQVVELHSFRRDDKANPRVEVEVRKAIR